MNEEKEIKDPEEEQNIESEEEKEEQPQVPVIKDAEGLEDTGQSFVLDPRGTTGGTRLSASWRARVPVYIRLGYALDRVFQVVAIDSSNRETVQTGWTFTSYTTSSRGERNIACNATPPPGTTYGQYGIRILASSLSITANSNSNVVPGTNTPAQVALLGSIEWGEVEFNSTGTKLQATLTGDFGSSRFIITGLQTSILRILNSSNQAQTGWTFDAVPSSFRSGTSVTISVTPSSTAVGQFRFDISGLFISSHRFPGAGYTPSDPSPYIGPLTFNQGPRLETYNSRAYYRSGVFVTNINHTVTTLRDKIYSLERPKLSTSAPRLGRVRRFTRDGANNRAPEAETNLAAPPKPTGIGASYTFSDHSGFLIYNNKYYVGAIWEQGSNLQSSIEIYNTDGTHDSNFIVDTEIILGDISVYGNKLFLWNLRDSGTNNRTFQVRNISDGTLIRTVPMLSGSQRVYGIAVSSEYIYVTISNSANLWSILVYDHDYNRVPLLDTTTTYTGSGSSGNSVQYMDVNADRLYVTINTGSNSFRRIHYYTNVQNELQNTWDSLSLVSNTRSIAGIFIRSQPGRTVTTTNFEVQKRSGTAGSYRWAVDSNWTIAKSSDVTAESPWWTITATANSNVTDGTYRLSLKRNALGTHDPVESPELAVAFGTIANATWSNVSYTGTKLQGTLTFDQNTTGIEAADFEIQDSNNVVQTGWTFDTPSTTATSGTGITIAATPPNTASDDFKIVLKAFSVRGPTAVSNNSPTVAVATDTIFIENRPAVTVGANWVSPYYDGTKFRANLSFNGGTASGISASDFEILNHNNVVQTGWTFDTPSTIARENIAIPIAVTPPSGINPNLSFKFRIKANSVRGNSATTNNSPPINRDSNAAPLLSVFFTQRTHGLATDGTSLYTIGARRDPQNVNNLQNVIRKHTLSGTQDGNDIIANRINQRPGAVAGSIVRREGLVYRNNEFYRILSWYDSTTNLSYWSLFKYNSTFTTISFVWAIQAPTSAGQAKSLAINGNNVFILSGDRNASIYIHSLSTGSSVRSFSITNQNNNEYIDADSIAVSNNRVYVILRDNGQNASTVRSYDHSGNRQTTEETTFSNGFGQSEAATFNSKNIYIAVPNPDFTVGGSKIYNYVLPSKVATAAWSSVSYTSGKLQGTLTFSVADVTNIEATDFEIVNASGTVQTGWTFDTPSSTATAGTGITIAATPPSGLNSSFKIRLKATSVRSDGSSRDNAPAANVETDGVTVDSRPTLAVSTFTAPTGNQRGATATFTLDFDHDIPATELTTADFTATNGASVTSISPTTGTEDTYTLTVTQPTNNSGTYTVSLNANAVSAGTTYKAGPSAAFASTACTYDTRQAITVSSFTPPADEQTGTTSTFTLTFSRAVTATEVTTADFTSTSGTISSVTAQSVSNGLASVFAVAITNPVALNGTYTATLRARAVPNGTTYLEGPTADFTSGSVSYDTRQALVVSSFTAPTGEQNGVTATFVLDFNYDIPATELSTSDFTATGGASVSSINPTIGNEDTYNIVVTQPTNSDGTYTVSLNANAVSIGTRYKAGPAAIFTSTAATYDTRSVITAQWTEPTDLQTGTTSDFTLTFDQPILATELTNADFTLSDNTVTVNSITPTSGTQTTYTVRVNNPTSTFGSYTITLEANAIENGTAHLRGPENDLISTSVNYDTRPALTISSFVAPSGTQRGASSTFRITVSQAVPTTEIVAADFTTSSVNAVIGAVTAVSPASGNASIYDISVTNPSDLSGTYTVSINTGAIAASTTYRASPEATDPNRTSNAVTFDTRTAVTALTFDAPSGTQSGTTSSFTLTLDRAVPTGVIDVSDFSVQVGSGASISSITAQSPVSGTANIYIISVTNPTNSNGTYTITMAANSIPTTTTYLQGPTAAATSRAVTFDTRPTVEGTSFTAPTGTQRGATSVFRLVLNRSVPTAQITTGDFTASITQATIASVAGVSVSNNMTATYDITVNNPTNASGTYTISLNANAVTTSTSYSAGPSSAYASTAVTYNTVIYTGTWGGVTFSGNKLSSAISFSHNVTGIAASDFEVINDSNVVQTGWTFDTPTASVNTGSSVTIAATPPSNTNGNFGLRLKSNVLRFDGSSTDNGPQSTSASVTIAVDNRPDLTVTWTNPTGTQTGATSTFTVTFSQSVPATEVIVNAFTFPVNVTITISPTSGSNTAYTITATNPTNATGTYGISLDANSISATTTYKAGPSTDQASGTITYDTRQVITATWTVPSSGVDTPITTATGRFILRLNRSVLTSEISSSDFTY